jgi:predicted transcriptional regulator
MPRVNIMLSDDTQRRLARVAPRGRRSAIIERALEAYLTRLEREQATARLAELRAGAPPVESHELVTLLRESRHREVLA